MYQKMLLPNSVKKPGWLILIPATTIGIFLISTHCEPQWLNVKVFTPFPSLIATANFKWITTNLANTLTGIAFIIGAMMVGFSKEKEEDEYIANLRLAALLWAVIVNYSLLMLAFLLVYDIAFFTVMIYNMFTVLLLFIIRFNFLLYKNNKLLSHAE